MPRLTYIPLILILCAGCRAADAQSEPAERAPYQTTERGTLRVRDDLAAHLASATITAQGLPASLDGFGRADFSPGASYALRAPFDGFIERVHVLPGQQVAQGDLLATMRSGEAARLRAELRRVTAQLGAERASLARADRLLRDGAGAQREVQEASARVETLNAELRGIREALSAAQATRGSGDLIELRARQSGDILARNIEPGSRVSPADADPAFLIGDLERLVAMARFPERSSELLVEGAPCAITIPTLDQAPIQGSVVAVQRAVDPRSRTIRVACALPAPSAQLRLGMALKVSVQLQSEGILSIPRSALLLRRDAYVVLVKRPDDELERRAVVPGQRLGDAIQILSGLALGEQIITEGAVLLDGELDQLR